MSWVYDKSDPDWVPHEADEVRPDAVEALCGVVIARVNVTWTDHLDEICDECDRLAAAGERERRQALRNGTLR